MASPFPGMDPWLESPAIFPSLHNTFIACLQEAINAVIPPPYYAAIGTRVVVEGDSPDLLVEPDVDILRPTGKEESHSRNGGGGAATIAVDDVEVQPITVRVPREELIEWLLEVRTGDGGGRLVTAIELLSRSNKRAGGEGRAEYLRKQREMRERRVNVIEIDLLRGGAHTTYVPIAEALRRTGPFDYHICMTRPDRREECTVYPIRLPQRLAHVAVPLLPGSTEVGVSLQAVLDRCYDVGLYARRMDYSSPCIPPLTPEQMLWATGVLKAKGLIP